MWRESAENVADSLNKGMRVIVQGNLRSRQFENQMGERRTSWEVDVAEVGPALRYATAKVTRSTRQGSSQGAGWSKDRSAAADPWQQPATNNEPPY